MPRPLNLAFSSREHLPPFDGNLPRRQEINQFLQRAFQIIPIIPGEDRIQMATTLLEIRIQARNHREIERELQELSSSSKKLAEDVEKLSAQVTQYTSAAEERIKAINECVSAPSSPGISSSVGVKENTTTALPHIFSFAIPGRNNFLIVAQNAAILGAIFLLLIIILL